MYTRTCTYAGWSDVHTHTHTCRIERGVVGVSMSWCMRERSEYNLWVCHVGYRDQTQVVRHSHLLGLTSFLCGSFCSRTQQHSAFGVHTELKSLIVNPLREKVKPSGTRQNTATPGVEGLLLGRSGNFRQPVLVGSTRKHNDSQSRQLVSQATYVSGPKETPLLQILAVREML